MTESTRAVEELLSKMTLPEKVGQMTQASNESISPTEVTDHAIGSVLSGGNGNPRPNTPSVWADMVGSFAEAASASRLGVPLLYGVDAVHGHANVRGATVFPHNIGLGAIGDPGLVEQIGRATATEMLATGVNWAFAPSVAVPQDIRWGRTYEGYGRDPSLVATLGASSIRGLQREGDGYAGVLACAKHFVGDGATAWGTVSRPGNVDWWDGWGDTWQIDQGDARIPEAELRATHLLPYRAAIGAGVMSVMASYNSWNGTKVHGHRGLLADTLKGELGFGGFVVSDWMGIDQLDPSYDACVVTAVNAGIDMVMVPDEWHRFLDSLTRAVVDGRVALSRVDDAVRRILFAKAAAGIFDEGPRRPPLSVVGAREHRRLAAEAARRSAVLLKHDGVLPLSPATTAIEVGGVAADDIGLQCGGWTVGWQGGRGATTPGSTLLDGLRKYWDAVAYDPAGRFPGGEPADVGIVCIAEDPYAEGPGDRAIPRPTADDLALFTRMRRRNRFVVLVLYSGRPLVVPDLVDQADAVIAAWLPGTEGAALAELLVGTHGFEGRTPQPWPRSSEDLDAHTATPRYAVGHGLAVHTSAPNQQPPGVNP